MASAPVRAQDVDMEALQLRLKRNGPAPKMEVVAAAVAMALDPSLAPAKAEWRRASSL